jgi:hypothetical protein
MIRYERFGKKVSKGLRMETRLSPLLDESEITRLQMPDLKEI